MGEKRKPTDRIQVLARPMVSPGKCMVCGSADREVIDFGSDIEYYGVPYICCVCVIDAATKFDVVPGQKYRELEEEIKILKANTDKVQEYVDELTSNIALSSSAFLRRVGQLSGKEISTDYGSNSSEPTGNFKTGNSESEQSSGQSSSTSIVEGSSELSASAGSIFT